MDFNSLLSLVGDEPVFESALLLAGSVDPAYTRLQLGRWVKSGRLLQLRRGFYCVAPPYRSELPHPFDVANRLKRSSYVSLQTALAYYDLIPDTVQSTLSITGRRPERLSTSLGVFEYHHMRPTLLFGYQLIDTGASKFLIATPEKALLDLVYLQVGGCSPEYLEGLRLQNLERIDQQVLSNQAMKFHSPRIERAVEIIAAIARTQSTNFRDL
jgi:predicted transcriptional regulator of viral defense system